MVCTFAALRPVIFSTTFMTRNHHQPIAIAEGKIGVLPGDTRYRQHHVAAAHKAQHPFPRHGNGGAFRELVIAFQDNHFANGSRIGQLTNAAMFFGTVMP